MPIFVTYARKDRSAIEALARDLERSRNAVWLDNELTGGQVWWDTILGQIRACDLYIFALSPESLKSRACNLELQYALAVNRPLLPVLVRDVHISLAPPAIANTQIVDYRTRTADTGIALVSAVANRPPAPALPGTLPDPPAPPISYMNQFQETVDASFLTFQEQNHLLADLRGYLAADEDERIAAVELIRSLRRRRDVAEGIAREIDQILSPPAASQPSPPPSSGATPSTFQPIPQPAQPMQRQSVAQQPLAAAPPFYSGPQSGPTHQPVRQPSSWPAPSGTPVGRTAAVGPGPYPQGVIIFTLALLSPFTCAVTGIIALIMASSALKAIDAQPGAYTNRSLIATSRVIAIIGLAIAVIVFLYYIGTASSVT